MMDMTVIHDQNAVVIGERIHLWELLKYVQCKYLSSQNAIECYAQYPPQ